MQKGSWVELKEPEMRRINGGEVYKYKAIADLMVKIIKKFYP